jgi:hypothetical protein
VEKKQDCYAKGKEEDICREGIVLFSFFDSCLHTLSFGCKKELGFEKLFLIVSKFTSFSAAARNNASGGW